MLIPAAQYVRTSVPFQDAYLDRQKAMIADFARKNGFRIVRTYADSARSGVVLSRRKAMQSLLNDILQQKATYRSILVYDVSRWGRFQDVDEAAHYEFLCRSSGVPVYYCDEPYLNKGNITGAVFKNMRRCQAGEFSRELSEKTYRAKKHVAELGFRVGGAAGYGLRRRMISKSGQPLQQLASGEHKYGPTNRIILVPGPKREVEHVREIFAMAAANHGDCQQIVREMNRRNVRFHTGRIWDYYDIYRMLTNPKYKGQNVWGRTSVKLKSPARKVGPENWVIKEGAFAPIVDACIFNRVQEILRNRREPPWTGEELLSRLRKLHSQKGKLSQRIIDDTPGMPSSATYYAHFGPLRRVYPLIDYRPEKGTFTKIFRRDQNERLRAELFSQIHSLFHQDISLFHFPNRKRLILRLDNGLSISVVLCRSLKLKTGQVAWKLYPTRAESDYVTLLCRLNKTNEGFLDFYLFPFIEKRSWFSFKQGDPWLKKGKRLFRLKDLCREAKMLSRIDDASRNLRPLSLAHATTLIRSLPHQTKPQLRPLLSPKEVLACVRGGGSGNVLDEALSEPKLKRR
jgi:DNA invertase Pin-like site-specific DNA recombinase